MPESFQDAPHSTQTPANTHRGKRHRRHPRPE